MAADVVSVLPCLSERAFLLCFASNAESKAGDDDIMGFAPLRSDSDYFNRNMEFLFFARLTHEEVRDLFYILKTYPGLIGKQLPLDDRVYVKSCCSALTSKLMRSFRNLDSMEWIK